MTTRLACVQCYKRGPTDVFVGLWLSVDRHMYVYVYGYSGWNEVKFRDPDTETGIQKESKRHKSGLADDDVRKAIIL